MDQTTLNAFGDRVVSFLSDTSVVLIIAHAVNTWPTPKNQYGQWVLGMIKFIVGQRISGTNAFNGLQSEVTAVTTAQKDALADGSMLQIVKRPSSDVSEPVAIIPLKEPPRN
jgi:hypothetical protein